MTPQCGVFIYFPLFDILFIAHIKVFINSIVAVWMVITLKLWVDADCDVVLRTIEEVFICAGLAAIARVTAGLSAAVRIPIVGSIVLSDDCVEVLTIFLVICESIVNFPGADGLIVYLYIFFFSAPLIDGEDPVREVLASGRI